MVILTSEDYHLFSSLLIINKFLSPTACHHIHPFLRKTSCRKLVQYVLTNPKIGSRQHWHEPVSTLYLITHLPNLRPLGELETDSREEKQFSAQIRHPSRGAGRFWLTRDGGGEKNTRWNHSYLKGWADGRKPCHWLNFGKYGLLCKVIPTLYLHSSQDTGCGSGCFLRSYMLTLESTEFKIQNCSNLLLRFSIFNSLRGKNTTKRITLLIVYIILMFSVQKKPTQSHCLFYSKN